MGYFDPPDYDPPCEVCGYDPGDCKCPECPECGEQGNPKCQADHGLDVSGIAKFVPVEEADPDPSIFDEVEPGCAGCGCVVKNVKFCHNCAALPLKCPHGFLLDGDCSACDVAADMAFDAGRENRNSRGAL